MAASYYFSAQGKTSMRIIVSGSTGLIGSAVCGALMNRGHRVVRLVRPQTLTTPNLAPLGTIIQWDPARDRIDAESLDDADVVIHLSGENVSGRWTTAKKHRLLYSRVDTTALLARTLSQLINPPRLFLCASAVGYYGDRGDELLNESSPSGGGFLAEVCRRWEAASAPAAQRGIRTAQMRFGVVLSRRGGALKMMLPIFKLGLGGKLGTGRQYVPWISINDAAAAVAYLAENDDTLGPYNITAPSPVTNAEFTEALARRLKRPAFFNMPETLLTLVMGEMADHLLFASARVVPQRLEQCGFRFTHAELATALRELI
jgi:uncharacterized protein